jgi:DNA-directed RNA polymerase specialized sigma24 family protein
MLKFYFNYSGKEISKALEIPENQIATYYKRAKQKFKEKYQLVA